MKTQFEVFTAVMNNFGDAQKALTLAQKSSGSAMKENAAYMESLQAKVNNLKAQFTELVLGNGGLTSIAKMFLELSTNILKFINDIGGLQTVLITVTGLLIAFKGALVLDKATQVLSFITNLSSGIKGLVYIIPNAITAWNAYKNGIVSANTAMQATMPVIGLLTIALGALSLGYSKVKQSEEEAEQARQQTIQNAQQEIEALESVEEQINNESLSREQLIDLIQNSSISAYADEISALSDVNEMRQAAIDKINEEKMARAQDIVDTGFSDYESALESESGFGEESISKGYKNVTIENQIEELKKLKEELINTRAEYEKGSSMYDNFTNKIKGVSDELSRLEDKHKDNLDIIEEFDDALNTLGKKYDKTTGTIVDMTDAEKEAFEASKDSEDTLDDVGDAADDVSSKLYDLGSYSSDSFSLMNEATKDQQDLLSSLSSEIDSITSAYQTAVDALYEYNNQGYLSVDTYSQLMQLAPQYLAMMINENGQLYANADGVTTLYQAKVYEMGITAARAQVNLAASLAGEAGAYANLGNAAINASGGLWELVKAEMAEKIAKVEDPSDLAALENRINAINDLTQSTIAHAKATTSSIKPTQAATGATNKNTGANKGNTGSRKSNTDAIKAQTNALKAQKEALEAEADALEKEIDDYETVIDYVKDLLKEEQEAVEDEKDAQLEAIQDKIDALEEEQEAFEDNIEAQLDALEDQKDEVENYWDAQIDAIQNANDVLEENIKLQQLQEAVSSAKTQKVKVLKDGRFTYAEDEEAISNAEQELADYEMELAVERQIAELERLKEEALNSLEKQIEELENYRDKTKDNYDQQLKDLQNYYDAVEAEYDFRIKQYDQWLKQFEDMLEASSKRHAELLYNELVGEQGNWDARIAALGNFVQRYEQKKNELDGIKSQIEAIDNQIKALQSSANSSIGTMNARLGQAQGLQNQIAALANSSIERKRYYVHDSKGTNLYATRKYSDWYPALQEANSWIGKNKDMLGGAYGSTLTTEYYAKGTYSTPEDQIALVADPIHPSNRELVVGSKINQGDGVLASLKKGTGVIPSGRNLTENLINLAKWSSNGGFERTFTTMNQSSSKIINIENINLPEVKNGEDFVQYLENNFINDSIQFANIRG